LLVESGGGGGGGRFTCAREGSVHAVHAENAPHAIDAIATSRAFTLGRSPRIARASTAPQLSRAIA